MQKRLIIFAVALLLLFISYKFLGKIVDDFANSKLRRDRKKELENFLQQHPEDEGGQNFNNVKTYSAPEYKLMADALFEAMDGFGTDEPSIYAIISRLRTKMDWLALVDAFGNKKSSWGNFEGNLVNWLVDELGGSDKLRINNILGKFNAQI